MPQNKLSLTSELKQEQTLSPVQLQSLELLLSPIMELNTKIEQELTTNPVLEEDNTNNLVEKKDPENLYPDNNNLGEESAENPDEDDINNFINTTRIDNSFNNDINKPDPNEQESKYNHFFNSIIDKPTLEDDLLEQLSFANPTDEEKKLAELIIGSLDSKGYLGTSLEEIARLNNSNLETAKKALNLVQSFEPAGIAARDIRECLLIQLKQKEEVNSIAEEIIKNHLNDLERNNLIKITEDLNISKEELNSALEEIKTLNPYPWRDPGLDKNTIIIPEISIIKEGENYKIYLKEEALPKLQISNYYINLLHNENIPKGTKEYIKQKILKGKTIIKGIEQRQQTIKKIAEVIIDTQYEFLEKGKEFLKPLTMREVADKIDVHETTVSRAVSQKYAETPQGIFELKYFFTTGYQSDSGDLVSNRVVMEKIKDLISIENNEKPLSDGKIAEELNNQGIPVARRTVAKYREELGIPSSRLRKKHI